LELPTVLFGLGAIALAHEPRGAIHQIVHRRRRHRPADQAPPTAADERPEPAPATTTPARP
jgi:hypothetical protein